VQPEAPPFVVQPVPAPQPAPPPAQPAWTPPVWTPPGASVHSPTSE
jgi:hypothetical protein